MSRRLPQPAPGELREPRCVVSAAELRAIEDAAHLCRLSVTSFIRVALVEAAAHPERVEEWLAIAERLTAEGAGRPKPGRPKGEPKTGKKK